MSGGATRCAIRMAPWAPRCFGGDSDGGAWCRSWPVSRMRKPRTGNSTRGTPATARHMLFVENWRGDEVYELAEVHGLCAQARDEFVAWCTSSCRPGRFPWRASGRAAGAVHRMWCSASPWRRPALAGRPRRSAAAEKPFARGPHIPNSQHGPKSWDETSPRGLAPKSAKHRSDIGPGATLWPHRCFAAGRVSSQIRSDVPIPPACGLLHFSTCSPLCVYRHTLCTRLPRLTPQGGRIPHWSHAALAGGEIE